VVSSEGKITHWHTTTGKVLHQMQEESPLMCLDYSSDGSTFVTAGNDRQIRVYDDNMKSIVTTMKPGGMYNPGHSNRVFSVCYHRGFTGMLASGGWDNTVQFYDVRAGTITNSIYGPHICGDALDFKDYMLLTGSWSSGNQVQIWDIRNFKLIETMDWDKDKTKEPTYCYASQFSKDKNSSLFGVGCSNMNMVRMFDNSNDNLPMMNSHLNKACYAIDYSFNGKYFAFGSGDGNIRVLNIDKK
jgi:COMPASS component SWD3